MTTATRSHLLTTARPARRAASAPQRLPRVFGDLGRPGQMLEHITPNWYASVMGTGIVANAAATLPLQVTGLHTFATVVWLIASTALVALTVAFAAHWTLHRGHARAHAAHPVMSQFYGAPPMAMLTVGAGAITLGPPLIGSSAAVWIDAVLWTAGTLTGLATSVWIPFRMITTHDHDSAMALPAWLMPIVPPMVSASTGALLLDHVPAGQPRLALIAACYAMFGLSLFLGMITMTMIYSRLVHGGMPAVQAAPTVWITLGMIGQSITATNLLGTHAATVFVGKQAIVATGLHVFGIAYGFAMGGFGILMFALATMLTVHVARRGLSFSLTWWSFTFPVGTCVTGATALGTAAGISVIHAMAVALYVVLLGAWATVATHTIRGTITGRVFLPA
ncbi:TDT family transporter [Williamsia serinedens]|uniref:C4-dicarboxylate transporter/malic acid transport protein n=1 Tax=Williamsia serinedens TaxID=391736 RepID=A0ABT1H5L2_9NOCA|nr:TDT family transporter [Williamsia serinedens]MCP2162249.1 C4-dicarboxylate transporter/malic acid transport protein [Williamsia serinedens]